MPRMQKFGRTISPANSPFFDRISSARYRECARRGRKLEWFASCAGEGCEGEFSLELLRRHGRQKCDACNFCFVFETERVSKSLEPVRDRIIAVSRVKQTSGWLMDWWMQCQEAACLNVFRCYDYTRHGLVFCKTHRIRKTEQKAADRSNPQSRFLFGRAVPNDVVWANKSKIIGFRPGTPTRIRTFLMTCETIKCEEVIPFREAFASRKQVCKRCAGNKLRLRPHESQFNTAILQASRRKKPRAWSITYDQFLVLCKIASCFYCRTDLLHNEYVVTRKKQRVAGRYAYMLDRADNSMDYTLNNVVPCCSLCNTRKNYRRTAEFMLRLAAEERGDAATVAMIDQGFRWDYVYENWIASRITKEDLNVIGRTYRKTSKS